MKKLALVCLILGIGINLNGQVWFEAAAKGTYGFTGFLNKNAMDDGRVSYKLGQGYGYGGRFGINFGYYNGISFETMFNQNTQLFDTEGALGLEDNHSIVWNNVDMYFLYRLYTEKTFLEIGPKWSRLSSLTHEIKSSGQVNNSYNIGKSDYQDYWSAALGFGTYVYGARNFSLMLGMRFEYALTDFISAQGQEKNLPLPTLNPSFESYVKSNPFAAQLCLEFNFGLGYFAEAACGRRGFFFKYD